MEENNSEYKGKLRRLFREIMLLSKSPFGLSVNELADKLGVSYRTVYRDLRILPEVGFPTEEVQRGRFVIRGVDREARKFEKNLQFTAEEAAILSDAVKSIPENHPMKKDVLEKLLSFSGMEDVMKVIVKEDISRNIANLAKAARDKKQVIFHNYASAHSQSIRSRRVEPYAFSQDGVFIKGYEIDSKTNKTFKIERIETVILDGQDWQFESEHESQSEPDIFGINGGESHKVKLRMSLRAARLLQEEFPLSAKHIYKEDATHYLFEAKVNSYVAVGRFVLGLIDEIEVVGPKGFKQYLEDRIAKRRF